MDGGIGTSHPEEDTNLNNGEQINGITPQGGPPAPTRPFQGGPSPAYVKENIDLLRTIIKELDNRGKKKVAHERLSYGDSENRELGNS